MKRPIVKYFIWLIAGTAIGVIGTRYYIGYSYQKIRTFFATDYLTYSEEIAFDAYKNESPEITRWAIERHIDIFHHYKKQIPYKNLINDGGLILSYLRLAKINKLAGSDELYEQNMSHALKLAKNNWRDGKEVTYERLLEYLELSDKAKIKNLMKDT